jgi:hypothetical protein
MKIIALLGPFALAACAPATDETSKQAAPETPPVELTKECDTAAGQYAVGKAFTDALAAEVKKKVGANSLRVIPPGMMVTMDYRGDRLNISYDEKKIITNVNCG